jgi:flagellar biosynthesis component FlhA
MFNHEDFARSMQEQSYELIPSEFSKVEKEYISTTIYNYTKIAGESLNNDNENNYSDEQKFFIAQIIAEWSFHKTVDIIRAKIPNKYRDAIMQKVAFTIFEISKQACAENISNDQILEVVEQHVVKVYKECVQKLLIEDKQKDIAYAQSNIDKMTIEMKKNNKFNWKDFLVKGAYIIFLFLIGLAIHCHCWYLYVAIGIIIIIYIGYYVRQKLYIRNQLKELENVRQQMQDLVNPDRMFDNLGVDVISLQVGQGLLCIADPDQDGQLLAKTAALRHRLTDDLGYIIPNVRIIDSNELQEYEYSISIRNNVVDSGFIYPNKYMIIADQWETMGKAVPENVIVAQDPTYKVKVYWVNSDIARKERGVLVVDSQDVIITHLQEVLIKHVDGVLSEVETKKYIDSVISNCNGSDEKLLSNLSYGDIRRVFVNLIREKISIKDIVLVLSRLEDYSRFHKESDILSERLRKDFSRQISLAHCNDDKKIYAIDLSKELTAKLLEFIELQKGFGKTKLVLDKQFEHGFVENVATKLMEKHKKINVQPVLLCDEGLRLGLYRLLVRHIPTIVVLADSEIEPDIKLEIVDTVNL